MAPATDWQEVISADEVERFTRHASALGTMQAQHAGGGALDRALHAKANLGVEAEFEVHGNLPEEARIGMFAAPRTYRAVARFSNGAGRRQADRKPDVRGLSVKLFGVDGKKVIPGMEDATTQDFLAIRTPVVPMRDADEFMVLVRAAATPALLPFKLIGALGLRRALRVMRAALAGMKAPQSSLAATSFYSALPIKFGPYAVQYAFRARDPVAPIKLVEPAQLGDELAAKLRLRPVLYDFQIRFYVDPVATPIEDASVEWNSPWLTVGTLTLPVQDPASPRGHKVAALVEQLAFDPWHARDDLRPLGNIMRARNHAYRVSTQARAAAPEPAEPPRFD
jgi:hypothetical protein